MKRLALLGLIGWVFVSSCGDAGIGDTCAPQRPGGQPCSGSSDAGSSGCFQGSEIYIETQSLQCRSRICLVYRYSENPTSTARERAQHIYCTCRCGVPADLQATTDRSVLCTCPEGFTCVSNLAGPQFNAGVQGSYCVRSSTVGDGGRN